MSWVRRKRQGDLENLMVVCDGGNFTRRNFRLKRKLRGSRGSSTGEKFSGVMAPSMFD